MAYVSIPKDLSNVKTKVMLNLTKRQLICFSLAALVGIPVFFLTKEALGSSNAVLFMMMLMFPFFMFGLYEKNGQPLEVILKHYIDVKFLRSKTRPYITNNFYAVLEKQVILEKEVETIVRHQNCFSKQSNKTN